MRATVAALRRFVRGGGGLARKGRGPLHAKFGPRNYYKGNRTRSLGRHTRKGRFRVDWANKVPVYMLPGNISHPMPLAPPPPHPETEVDTDHQHHHQQGMRPQRQRPPPSLAVGAPGWDHGLRPYVSARTPKIVVPPP